MIAYSPEAEPARAFLLRRYNDIEVYVEDTSCQNLYIVLVNRVLRPKGKRISHVFPLGGKSRVISRCSSDQTPSTRKRIYLIDGDLDLMLKRPRPRLRHLYRLNVYCAENLLLSEFAAITIGTESATNVQWHDMALQLSLKKLMESSVRKLMPLFVVYSIVHEFGLTIDTVSYPVQRLLKVAHDATTLSGLLIRQRMRDLIRAIQAHVSPYQYLRKKASIAARLAKSTSHPGGLISGKDYLLPLVYMRLRQVARFSDSFDKLKVRLAQHCELTIDRGFARAILRELR